MSEPAAKLDFNKGSKVNVVMVNGLIQFPPRKYKTQSGSRWAHVVRLPAPDEFTSPQTVEIQANEKLGDPGDRITVECDLGGIGRRFNETNEDGTKGAAYQTAWIRLTAK